MSDRGELRGGQGPGGLVWPGTRPAAASLLRRWASAFNPWLWLFVFFPTLIAGVYYFGVASNLYMSEAKFVVRSESRAPSSMLGTLLQNTGLVRSTDDTFSVEDFILSRDAVRDLEAKDHLRAVFDRPGADFISRFPNLFSGSSFEALYRHYLDYVEVSFDSTTGVSTLRVKAYRPEDAQAIATALLADSETLVNRLNQRAAHDTLALAQNEVTESEQRLTRVQAQLTAYRIRQQILDPKLTSTGVYDALKQLTAARLTAATQLAELTRSAPASPEIPYLRTRLAALDQQLADARAKVTGGSDSVALKLADYERLTLERELAEKSLVSATASLERARAAVQRQQLYIERVVQPNLPDYPLYPKRFVSFFMVMVTCLIAYGIAWLLIAGIREHAAA